MQALQAQIQDLQQQAQESETDGGRLRQQLKDSQQRRDHLQLQQQAAAQEVRISGLHSSRQLWGTLSGVDWQGATAADEPGSKLSRSGCSVSIIK